MIDVKIETKHLEIIDRYNKKIGAAEPKLKGLSIYASHRLVQRARFYLTEEIGTKASLYSIVLIPAGFMATIVIRPIDDKGALIYHGSKPHSYSGKRPMPIADGVFAYRVNHPGFKGKKKEIRRAMRKAAKETREEVEKILRRGFIV